MQQNGCHGADAFTWSQPRSAASSDNQTEGKTCKPAVDEGVWKNICRGSLYCSYELKFHHRMLVRPWKWRCAASCLMWCSPECSLFHLPPLRVHLHSSCDYSKPSDAVRVSVMAGNLHTGSIPDMHFHLTVGWYPLLCMYVHSHVHCCFKYRIRNVNVQMNRYLQEASQIAPVVFQLIFSARCFFFNIYVN